jgi:hypothetical protein
MFISFKRACPIKSCRIQNAARTLGYARTKQALTPIRYGTWMNETAVHDP